MKYKSLCLLIICSIITQSKSSKPKGRTTNRTKITITRNIKPDLGYIHPINLRGAPKINISTLINKLKVPKSQQRHQLAYLLAERAPPQEEREVEPVVAKVIQREEAQETKVSEEDDEREDKQDDQSGQDKDGDDRYDESDSDQSPVMRNSPLAEDDLIYDFDEEELRIPWRK